MDSLYLFIVFAATYLMGSVLNVVGLPCCVISLVKVADVMLSCFRLPAPAAVSGQQGPLQAGPDQGLALSTALPRRPLR